MEAREPAEGETENLSEAELRADQAGFGKGLPPPATADNKELELRRAEALEDSYHGMVLPLAERADVGAPQCQRCEVMPEPARGPGVLYLYLPHTHTLGKVLGLLAAQGWAYEERGGTVGVHVPPGSLAPLLSPLENVLTFPEQRDARILFQHDGRMVTLSDYFEAQPFRAFVARERAAWLIDLMRERRLYGVFQPIVSLQSGQDEGLHGYEGLLRARVEGRELGAGSMLDVARAADLTFQLDLYARRAVITDAARFGVRSKLFVNCSPSAIYDPTSCLRATVKLLDELGFPRGQVVFEIVESERLPDPALLRRIVAYYREHGFGVALDDVGAGYSSLSVLLDLKPDYAKIDRALVSGVNADAGRARVVRNLIETAHDFGARVILEGIEREEELAWARENGADFAQGYLIARPAAPPPRPKL